MGLFLTTALAIGVSTVAGTVIGMLIRRIPHRYNDLILGGASGIMLASAVLGLIVPASESVVRYALLQIAAGMFAGAFLVSVLDRLVPHLHNLAGLDRETHPRNEGTGKVLLFVSAIAMHKLPEGLAAGVSFGTGDAGDILTVTGSLALQNVPESVVIVAPLLAIGVTLRRTFLISVLIGAVSVAGMVTGYLLIHAAAGFVPFFLSFAGGAMLYVVSDEMIPETHSHGYEKSATFAMLSGFLLVLIFQNIMENAG